VSGYASVGPFGSSGGSGNDNQGRKVPIVDILLPMPRGSSSFYRDGNGRSLAGSLVEREGPAVSASGSVAMTDLLYSNSCLFGTTKYS
jgi:hypothetical protein